MEAGSPAEELEIEAGDRLLSVNGREVEDVFDYRTAIASDVVTLLILKPDGEEWEYEIENGGEDPGLVFENGLMSEYRSCTNNCIFCFIDQMPKGMRDTLYFKDDDSRLSFLQGNYITLTNMKDADIRHIIRYRLEPINISVHSTNPELRVRMLHNRFAGEKQFGAEDFTKCPNGAPGVEERLSLMFSEGFMKGRLTLPQVVKYCCANPARMYGLYPKKGTFLPGADADLVLIDPSKRRTLTHASLHGAADYTCYEGMELQGVIRSVYLRGRQIVKDNVFLGQKGDGRYLKRGRSVLAQ